MTTRDRIVSIRRAAEIIPASASMMIPAHLVADLCRALEVALDNLGEPWRSESRDEAVVARIEAIMHWDAPPDGQEADSS